MKTPLRQMSFKPILLASTLLAMFTLSACSYESGSAAKSSVQQNDTVTEHSSDIDDQNSQQEQEQPSEAQVELNDLVAPENFNFETKQTLQLLLSARHGDGMIAANTSVRLYAGVQEGEWPEQGNGIGEDLIWSGVTDDQGKLDSEILLGQAVEYVYLVVDVFGKSNQFWIRVEQPMVVDL